MKTLVMGVIYIIADSYRQEMWSRTTFMTYDSWQYMNVPVGSASPFNLVFEAERGANIGIVAIDDISLTPGCYKGGKTTTLLHIAGAHAQFFFVIIFYNGLKFGA